jgi:hypothetical protein
MFSGGRSKDSPSSRLFRPAPPSTPPWDDTQTGGKENQGMNLGPKILQAEGKGNKNEQHVQRKEEFQKISSGGIHLSLLWRQFMPLFS